MAAANWSFPVRALVGAGRRREIPAVLSAARKSRPLIVTDAKFGQLPVFEQFVKDVSGPDCKPSIFTGVHPNPLVEDVTAGVKVYRDNACDSVICLGGGSGLDAGKSIACMAGQDEDIDLLRDMDFWEPCAEKDARLRQGVAPVVTVPTTAGTGAEMGVGSMVTNTATAEKHCVGHSGMPILAAVLDAELTYGLPKTLTAWTGMDAMVHALEALFVPEYHPMCDGAALQALRSMQVHLPRATHDGDHAARAEMLVASALAAVAFQKGLGAIHGLSEPFGAVYDSHHGLTNAILMPYVLRDLMERRAPHFMKQCPDLCAMLRLDRPVPASGPADLADAAAVVRYAEEACRQMEIPEKLGDIITADQLAALRNPALPDLSSLSAKAARNPTGFTNAVKYGQEDYLRILEQAL